MDPPFRTLGAAATPEQREALASPLRLEIYGQFPDSGALSVRELARRMGRGTSSLYYHVNRLVDVGLLREAGERPRGTRSEILYETVDSALRLEPDGSAETREALLRTMAAAFRMAERDLETALEELPPDAPGRRGMATFATRLHFRATREELDEVRGHLGDALEAVERLSRKPAAGPEAGSHHSLTLALLPLRGRSGGDEPE